MKKLLMLRDFHKNFVWQGLIEKVGNKSPFPTKRTKRELGIQKVYVEILENGWNFNKVKGVRYMKTLHLEVRMKPKSMFSYGW